MAQIHPLELLAETLRIAERCDFSLDVLCYEHPDEIVPHGHTPTSYLRELTHQGLRGRFPQGVTKKFRGLGPCAEPSVVAPAGKVARSQNGIVFSVACTAI
jgi:DNA polymerase III alpha subunit